MDLSASCQYRRAAGRNWTPCNHAEKRQGSREMTLLSVNKKGAASQYLLQTLGVECAKMFTLKLPQFNG